MNTFLNKTLADVAKNTANDLAQVETISGFKLQITITGRVEGDLLLNYILSDEYDSYVDQVKGNDLQEVIDEYKRRHGWKRAHAPLLISAA